MGLLHQPLEKGKLILKNRLVFPPMATSKAEPDGRISRDILDYYEEKSKGGHIGLLIVEHSFVSQEGKVGRNQLSIADDSKVDDLRKLSAIIHKNDSKAVMQINHAGRDAAEEITGLVPVAPSAVPNPENGIIPHELTAGEIAGVVSAFRAAALRVKEAGFDGVEIHSAHGYLLNQFFSPLTNKRTDEYGGSISNRIRIHLEIIKAIKEASGENFAILLRLGASDYTEGGTTIEDSIAAAGEFEKAGVDILDISGGFCRNLVLGNSKVQGIFSPLSEAVRKAVSIPVILTGGITEASAAEELLEQEKTDLVGVGRAIFKDSDWAKRVMGI